MHQVRDHSLAISNASPDKGPRDAKRTRTSAREVPGHDHVQNAGKLSSRAGPSQVDEPAPQEQTAKAAATTLEVTFEDGMSNRRSSSRPKHRSRSFSHSTSAPAASEPLEQSHISMAEEYEQAQSIFAVEFRRSVLGSDGKSVDELRYILLNRKEKDEVVRLLKEAIPNMANVQHRFAKVVTKANRKLYPELVEENLKTTCAAYKAIADETLDQLIAGGRSALRSPQKAETKIPVPLLGAPQRRSDLEADKENLQQKVTNLEQMLQDTVAEHIKKMAQVQKLLRSSEEDKRKQLNGFQQEKNALSVKADISKRKQSKLEGRIAELQKDNDDIREQLAQKHFLGSQADEARQLKLIKQMNEFKNISNSALEWMQKDLNHSRAMQSWLQFSREWQRTTAFERRRQAASSYTPVHSSDTLKQLKKRRDGGKRVERPSSNSAPGSGSISVNPSVENEAASSSTTSVVPSTRPPHVSMPKFRPTKPRPGPVRPGTAPIKQQTQAYRSPKEPGYYPEPSLAPKRPPQSSAELLDALDYTEITEYLEQVRSMPRRSRDLGELRYNTTGVSEDRALHTFRTGDQIFVYVDGTRPELWAVKPANDNPSKTPFFLISRNAIQLLCDHGEPYNQIYRMERTFTCDQVEGEETKWLKHAIVHCAHSYHARTKEEIDESEEAYLDEVTCQYLTRCIKDPAGNKAQVSAAYMRRLDSDEVLNSAAPRCPCSESQPYSTMARVLHDCTGENNRLQFWVDKEDAQANIVDIAHFDPDGRYCVRDRSTGATDFVDGIFLQVLSAPIFPRIVDGDPILDLTPRRSDFPQQPIVTAEPADIDNEAFKLAQEEGFIRRHPIDEGKKVLFSDGAKKWFEENGNGLNPERKKFDEGDETYRRKRIFTDWAADDTKFLRRLPPEHRSLYITQDDFKGLPRPYGDILTVNPFKKGRHIYPKSIGTFDIGACDHGAKVLKQRQEHLDHRDPGCNSDPEADPKRQRRVERTTIFSPHEYLDIDNQTGAVVRRKPRSAVDKKLVRFHDESIHEQTDKAEKKATLACIKQEMKEFNEQQEIHKAVLDRIWEGIPRPDVGPRGTNWTCKDSLREPRLAFWPAWKIAQSGEENNPGRRDGLDVEAQEKAIKLMRKHKSRGWKVLYKPQGPNAANDRFEISQIREFPRSVGATRVVVRHVGDKVLPREDWPYSGEPLYKRPLDLEYPGQLRTAIPKSKEFFRTQTSVVLVRSFDNGAYWQCLVGNRFQDFLSSSLILNNETAWVPVSDCEEAISEAEKYCDKSSINLNIPFVDEWTTRHPIKRGDAANDEFRLAKVREGEILESPWDGGTVNRHPKLLEAVAEYYGRLHFRDGGMCMLLRDEQRNIIPALRETVDRRPYVQTITFPNSSKLIVLKALSDKKCIMWSNRPKKWLWNDELERLPVIKWHTAQWEPADELEGHGIFDCDEDDEHTSRSTSEIDYAREDQAEGDEESLQHGQDLIRNEPRYAKAPITTSPGDNNIGPQQFQQKSDEAALVKKGIPNFTPDRGVRWAKRQGAALSSGGSDDDPSASKGTYGTGPTFINQKSSTLLAWQAIEQCGQKLDTEPTVEDFLEYYCGCNTLGEGRIFRCGTTAASLLAGYERHEAPERRENVTAKEFVNYLERPDSASKGKTPAKVRTSIFEAQMALRNLSGQLGGEPNTEEIGQKAGLSSSERSSGQRSTPEGTGYSGEQHLEYVLAKDYEALKQENRRHREALEFGAITRTDASDLSSTSPERFTDEPLGQDVDTSEFDGKSGIIRRKSCDHCIKCTLLKPAGQEQCISCFPIVQQELLYNQTLGKSSQETSTFALDNVIIPRSLGEQTPRVPDQEHQTNCAENVPLPCEKPASPRTMESAGTTEPNATNKEVQHQSAETAELVAATPDKKNVPLELPAYLTKRFKTRTKTLPIISKTKPDVSSPSPEPAAEPPKAESEQDEGLGETTSSTDHTQEARHEELIAEQASTSEQSVEETVGVQQSTEKYKPADSSLVIPARSRWPSDHGCTPRRPNHQSQELQGIEISANRGIVYGSSSADGNRVPIGPNHHSGMLIDRASDKRIKKSNKRKSRHQMTDELPPGIDKNCLYKEYWQILHDPSVPKDFKGKMRQLKSKGMDPNEISRRFRPLVRALERYYQHGDQTPSSETHSSDRALVRPQRDLVSNFSLLPLLAEVGTKEERRESEKLLFAMAVESVRLRLEEARSIKQPRLEHDIGTALITTRSLKSGTVDNEKQTLLEEVRCDSTDALVSTLQREAEPLTHTSYFSNWSGSSWEFPPAVVESESGDARSGPPEDDQTEQNTSTDLDTGAVVQSQLEQSDLDEHPEPKGQPEPHLQFVPCQHQQDPSIQPIRTLPLSPASLISRAVTSTNTRRNVRLIAYRPTSLTPQQVLSLTLRPLLAPLLDYMLSIIAVLATIEDATITFHQGLQEWLRNCFPALCQFLVQVLTRLFLFDSRPATPRTRGLIARVDSTDSVPISNDSVQLLESIPDSASTSVNSDRPIDAARMMNFLPSSSSTSSAPNSPSTSQGLYARFKKLSNGPTIAKASYYGCYFALAMMAQSEWMGANGIGKGIEIVRAARMASRGGGWEFCGW